MLIVTNFKRFPESWKSVQGVSGNAVMADTAWRMLRLSRRADIVVINCSPDLTYRMAALYLLFPFLRRPILSHDLVLRKPLTRKAKYTAWIKKLLLSRVDHFSLQFRMLDGYRNIYGIGPERASYVPFKANIRHKYQYGTDPDGEYVLCFGRSERDYDTFFRAMELLPEIPAAIPPPDFKALAKHVSRFTFPLSGLPANVRILQDEGTMESLIRIIEKAHVVVLPMLGSRIAPAGIGTYMNAMAMGKCVILTDGPGAGDVLTDEVLLVPPEDPGALARTIRRAWEDDGLRRRTALAAKRYAESCGGEPEIRQRVIDCAVENLWLKRKGG